MHFRLRQSGRNVTGYFQFLTTLTVTVCSYSVHVQRVHGEVVGVHFKVVEDFLESDLLTAPLQDHAICLCLVCGLYKFQ